MDGLHRLSWFPGFRELIRLYRRCQNSSPNGSFEKRALATLGITFELDANASNQIPQVGPLIIAANHPTGVADGLVLLEAVRQRRRDVRILANHLLACIPEMHDACFFIDPFGGKSSANRNVPGVRAAYKWLRSGRAILLFPAGEVAWRGWFDARRTGATPVDSEWRGTVGHLAMATHAPVVTAYIHGRNSTPFYAAGLFHPKGRTLLLGRELLHKRGKTFNLSFGPTIAVSRIRAASTAENATRLIRGEFDALSVRHPASTAEPIAPAGCLHLRQREIASLPCEAKLLSTGIFDVYCTDSTLIPHVLDEIGRLREVTFRGVGEGTGRGRDIDHFDSRYRQLFVWDRVNSEIVGAYRIGATDEILPTSGVHGLYTSTLFRYDESLLTQVTPALELGRSFVRAEYQRSHSALLLLWKGIGTLVARSPHYRFLFGAVSISRQYDDDSRALLRNFLSQHHLSNLAPLVHARNPPLSYSRPAESTVAEHRVMPVLLRQYLRLNAKVLGFNVDRSFADALDALMIVDLTTVPAAVLGKYLGRDNASAFLAYHTSRPVTPQRAA
jgi:putative hemolysin